MNTRSETQHLAQCTHCGAPMPGPASAQASAQPLFCCMGCERVHHLILDSGLETFYQVKAVGDHASAGAGVQTVQRDVDDATLRLIEAQVQHPVEEISEVTVSLEGLHCAGCVWLIEQLPVQCKGVHQANVVWSSHQLALTWDARTSLTQIASWLGRYGYHVHPVDAEANSDATTKPLLRRVGVAWAVAANVMLLTLAHYAGLGVDGDPVLYHGSRVITALLSTLVLFYGADIFLRRAWLSLKGSMTQRRLRWSMDVPLSLGVMLMWSVSIWHTIRGVGDVWFDSMSMLTAALLTSRWLQLRANIAARRATARLFALLPKTARVVDEDGEVTVISSDALEPGMRVQVRAGELFPADGVMVWGQTMVHRGVLTGESRPEPLAQGAMIEAGVQNMQNTVTMEVQVAGHATKLGQLQTWVQDHAKRRAPLELLVDRYGSWFVLVVVLIATMTMLVTHLAGMDDGLQRAVAILVVSCPCALAMATPLTLAMGMGQAAQRGMFIKYDDVIESLAKVDAVVFDKTGTLTHGQMRLVDHQGDADALVWAAALEYGDNHPIAQGIYNAVTVPAGLLIEDIVRTPGQGVEGTVDGHHVVVGAPNWVISRCADDQQRASMWLESKHKRHTPIFIAVDGQLSTMLCLGDRLRAESKQVIERLQASGIQTILLSGDDVVVAREVGAQLNMDQAIGGVTHEEKHNMIQTMQADGQVVMMIGDGVNDALALQRADVGVAMHNSAQISLQACDVFLHHGDGPSQEMGSLYRVESLLLGTRRIMRTVRRTVSISVGYNVLAIALAAAAWISPLSAAILMPVSSLTVVLMACLSQAFHSTESRGDDLPVILEQAV